MTNLYILLNDENIDINELDKAKALVSRKRKQKAEKYRNDIDIRNSLAVELMLRQGLKKDFGISGYEINDDAKPYLVDSDICFNMSHCGKGSVVAISNKQVGVDIEEIKSVKQAVKDKICNKKELVKCKTDLDFIKIWTNKEAYTKLNGTGIGELENIDTTELSDCSFFIEDDEYVLCLCQKEDGRINIRYINSFSNLLEDL